jgi:hypothetical protein
MTGFAVGSFVGVAGIRRLSFEEGLSRLNGKKQKKLENNTYLVRVDETTLGVQLHNTIVVYIFKSGIYQLDTGGWRTVTTKNRINRYNPARVSQKNNIWYIGEGIFEDGVRVDSDGKVLTKQRGTNVVEAKKRLLDGMVRHYIKGFVQHVIEHGLVVENAASPVEYGKEPQPKWDVVELAGDRPKPLAPSPADCWACYFGLSAEDDVKEPLGLGHLLEHMNDEDGPYYVPSLLWKAILVQRFANPAFIWRSINSDAKRGEGKFLSRILTAYFRKRKIGMLDLME